MSHSLLTLPLFVELEPCEDDDLEAEADSPDMEPGTEMDQGELSK